MNYNEVSTLASHSRKITTRMLRQYDYGIRLVLTGVNLPNAYEVHFSNKKHGGNAKAVLGDASGVLIPDEYLLTGEPIFAWVYLHTGQDDGESVYLIEIPVEKRPAPDPTQPTPVQQDIITQAIAVLNNAIEETAASEAAAAESAESAQTSATAAAESASSAQTSATTAQTAAVNASNSALSAQTSATAASTSEQNAHEYAESAEASADKAEQAAGQAGYMFISMDANGHLIYERTDNTDVDLSLDANGHLVMTGVA